MNNITSTISGYSIQSILGKNETGGRVTYQAVREKDNLPVVIKQFQFAKIDSDWSAYAAIENEISALKQLDHPRIPRYYDCIETENGLAIVTEYIDAPYLSCLKQYNIDEIKQIALSVLDILVYLQNSNPRVIHRDIKPENILIDSKKNVYLVDFGLAKLTDGAVGASSVIKGTPGFMPIEQLYNRELTLSSDLYSLGVTLVCLLTNTRSADVGNLIDDYFEIDLYKLKDAVSYDFFCWLKKLVATRVNFRFSSASEAYKSLLDINPVPYFPAEIVEEVNCLNDQDEKNNLFLSIFTKTFARKFALCTTGVLLAVGMHFVTSQASALLLSMHPDGPLSSCSTYVGLWYELLVSEGWSDQLLRMLSSFLSGVLLGMRFFLALVVPFTIGLTILDDRMHDPDKSIFKEMFERVFFAAYFVIITDSGVSCFINN